MFKIVIIDDEPMVRKGLMTVINWEALGCKVIGEAGNGVEGLELIHAHHPDIILTDINMPEVDGLRMIREVKGELENAKIIILTGYRDFDYIHEAMQLGAYDYLLKPSKLDEIVKVVKKAVLELKYSVQMESNQREWEQKFKKALPVLKEKLLRDLLINAYPVDGEVLEELTAYGIEMEAYRVILLEIDNTSDLYNRHLIKFGIINTFEELISDAFKYEKVDVGNNRVSFIANAIELEGIIAMLEEMIRLCENCFKLTVTASVSTVGTSPDVLSKKAQEVLTAIDYSFYLGKGSIILYEDLRLVGYEDISTIEPLALNMMRAIKLGSCEDVEQAILEIESVTKQGDRTYHQVDLKSFIVRCIYDIYNFVLVDSQLNPTDFDLEPVALHEEIQIACQYGDLILILKRIASPVTEAIHNLKQSGINNIIKEAMAYINENYSESVTLNDLSAVVNVSTYYLSRMFKKETGLNLTEYLNEVRLNAAKNLLLNTDLKLYEIGERVGISDPHYFSRLFKKHVGQTPTQFKEMSVRLGLST